MCHEGMSLAEFVRGIVHIWPILSLTIDYMSGQVVDKSDQEEEKEQGVIEVVLERGS